jgi:hypothetical protein
VDSLTQILDPMGRSLGLRVEDDGTLFSVHPRWLPGWFIILTQGLPWACLIGVAIWCVVREGAHPIWILIAILCTGFGGAYHLMFLGLAEREVLLKGVFVRLDRPARVLHLARLGIDLPEGEVISFILVRATIVERDDEGSSYERLFELSVLARKDSNEIIRHPVVTCMHRASATRVGRVLADFFHVDLQFLKAPRSQEMPQRAG